jgi:hypothetical protein
VALMAAQQEAQVTATAVAVVAAASENTINPLPEIATVRVNAAAVANGSEDAIDAARQSIKSELADFRGCRAGFVLVTAGGADEDVASGLILAQQAEDWIKDIYPDIFGQSAFDTAVFIAPDSQGFIQFKMFFFPGCFDSSG